MAMNDCEKMYALIKEELNKPKKLDWFNRIIAPLIVALIVGIVTYISALSSVNSELARRVERLENYAITNVKEINRNFEVIADALHVKLIKIDGRSHGED